MTTHLWQAALTALCVRSRQCAAEGIPRGTRGHDEWGFKKVRLFAIRVRPPLDAPKEWHSG